MNDIVSPEELFGTREWKQYRSHKIVRCALIVEITGDSVPDQIWVCPTADPFDNTLVDFPFDPADCYRFEPTSKDMLQHGNAGNIAMAYPDRYLSICPRQQFLEGYRLVADEPHPLLMSRDNPYGWKLEDLLTQLRKELEGKAAALVARDKGAVARSVASHNRQIAKLLERPLLLQHAALGILNSIGPDQGPLGAPGVG